MLAGAPALAQEVETRSESPEPRADKSGYSLLNPTPREFMRALNTDRPDTTESPITVDAGHVQLEMSFFDFAYDRHSDLRETSRVWQVAPLLLKVGLLDNVDLQLGLEPYDRARLTDRATDTTSTNSGFGDTLIRLKINLWGNDDRAPGSTAFGIMPVIRLPTAQDSLGDRHLDGGIIFPLGVQLAERWDLGTMAEFDFNHARNKDNYVVDFLHTLTIGYEVVERVRVYVEYAGFENFNEDEKYRGYFNTGVTWGITPDVQVDAGIRVGVTEAADDFGVFSGITLRF